MGGPDVRWPLLAFELRPEEPIYSGPLGLEHQSRGRQVRSSQQAVTLRLTLLRPADLSFRRLSCQFGPPRLRVERGRGRKKGCQPDGLNLPWSSGGRSLAVAHNVLGVLYEKPSGSIIPRLRTPRAMADAGCRPTSGGHLPTLTHSLSPSVLISTSPWRSVRKTGRLPSLSNVWGEGRP